MFTRHDTYCHDSCEEVAEATPIPPPLPFRVAMADADIVCADIDAGTGTDVYECTGHADMLGPLCLRCGQLLETSVDFLGRQFRVGQKVCFRNRRGVPYDGTIREICSNDSVKIKYSDRSWSGYGFDEVINVKDVATDLLGLSICQPPRSRRKAIDFTPVLSGDGKRYGSAPAPTSEKMPKPAKAKKTTVKKKAAVAPNKKEVVKMKNIPSTAKPPPTTAVPHRLSLRKSVPTKNFMDDCSASTVSDHPLRDEDGDATESDDEL